MERKPRCAETLMKEFICGDAGNTAQSHILRELTQSSIFLLMPPKPHIQVLFFILQISEYCQRLLKPETLNLHGKSTPTIFRKVACEDQFSSFSVTNSCAKTRSHGNQKT